MFSGIGAITLAIEGLDFDEGMMPGYQPNMPCTHYQQLSRHKRLWLLADQVPYITITEGIYTLIWT
jgi:hypothetical protein